MKVFLRVVVSILLLLFALSLVVGQIAYAFLSPHYQVVLISPWLLVIVNFLLVFTIGLFLTVAVFRTGRSRLILWGILLILSAGIFLFASQTATIKNSQNRLYSLSPNRQNVFYLQHDGKKATFYQSYYWLLARKKEDLPYPVKKVGKVAWLTNDSAAITYQATDDTLHMYLVTYGYRGSGLSYEYVTSLTRGKWQTQRGDLTLNNHLGTITVTDQQDSTEFKPDQIVQFGTTGVVLTAHNNAQYAYVISENAQYEPDGSPSNLKDTHLLLVKPDLKKLPVEELSLTVPESSK